MDRIRIENLEVFGNHGVYKEENTLGQKFLVSASLYTSTREAGLTDDIAKSIHYGDVCHFITRFMKEHIYQLIEAVAENLAASLLQEYENLTCVELEIKKPWAPIRLPIENVSVLISRCWHHCYIALGSNMGNKEAYLNGAIQTLNNRSDCKVLKVSEFQKTKPYGYLEQEDFLNGVLEMKTLLTPLELLEELQKTEQSANRNKEIHWGPRTLDLDILFFDKEIIDLPQLIIPHPDMCNRRFVLEPLSQIAGNIRHPIVGKTIEQLLEELDIRDRQKEIIQ